MVKYILHVMCVFAIVVCLLRSLLAIHHFGALVSFYRASDFLGNLSDGGRLSLVSHTRDLEKYGKYPEDESRALLDLYDSLVDHEYFAFWFGGTSDIEQLFINDNHLSIESYQVKEGRDLRQDDFKVEKETVSVLVGQNRKAEYQLGKTYKEYFGGKKDININIVGVLDGNSKFNFLSSLDVSVDDAIIVPWSKQLRDYSFLDEPGQVLYGSLPLTHDQREVQRIVDKINSFGAVNIEVNTVSAEIDRYKREYLHPIIIQLLIYVSICAASILYISRSIYMFFRNRRSFDLESAISFPLEE